MKLSDSDIAAYYKRIGFKRAAQPDRSTLSALVAAHAALFMPFQHSESLADQNRSVFLFSELNDPRHLKYAQTHQDIIARFGRFPHRDEILGRSPRPDEIAHQDAVPW